MKLKPAKNIRHINTSCATCRYGELRGGCFNCDRPHGFSCDAGDFTFYLMVCDGFRKRG